MALYQAKQINVHTKIQFRVGANIVQSLINEKVDI